MLSLDERAEVWVLALHKHGRLLLVYLFVRQRGRHLGSWSMPGRAV